MKKNPSSKRKLPNTWKKRDTVWAIMASICILIFVIHYSTLFVSASTTTGPQFPIYVENIDITPYQTYINNTYGGFWNLSQDNVIGWGNQENGYYVQWFAVPQVASEVQNYLSFSPNNLTSVYPSFDYNSNTITLQFWNLANNNNKPWRLICFYSNGVGPQYPYSAVFNNSSNVNLGVYGLTGKQLNYVSSTIYLTNNNAWVVNMPIFVNELIPTENTGHATEPTFDPDNNINSDGHAQQPNTPSFPTFIPPTIDTSTLETLVESLIDFVHEFADYVGECFSVFFSWLVEVIKNVGQSIYNAIIETAQFLYENFTSLFEPMMENVGHAVEPVQEDEIVQAFEDTEIYEDFSSMTDLVNDSFDVFDSIDEPNTFVIPIHLENVTMLNCGTQYIDLGWFDSCKTALRAFMWCITTFGLLYTIIDALPSYISGGDE